MPKRNSPGCRCCSPELCVNPVNPCVTGPNPDAAYKWSWNTRISFEPDEASPLVSGTPWRSVYHAKLTEYISTAGDSGVRNGARRLGMDRVLCGPTYDPSTRRWRGYTDSPPGEPDFPYRLWFEIASDKTFSVDPGSIHCHRRFWISDRNDVQQTPDFALNYTHPTEGPGLTEPICYRTYTDDPGAMPCQIGRLIDYEGLLPKFLIRSPRFMRLSIDGLSSPVQGDLSGDYLLDGSTYFRTAPPLDGHVTLPQICTFECSQAAGFNEQFTAGCPVNRRFAWSYMARGTPWCPSAATYQTIGTLNFWGNLTIWYVGRVNGWDGLCHVNQWQDYQLGTNFNPDTWEVDSVPFDLFGENPFVLLPSGQAPTDDDPNGYAGCTFPQRCTISFDSW